MTAVPRTNHHALLLGDAHLVRVCLDLQLDAMRGLAPAGRWVTPPGGPTAGHFLPGELLG